MTASKSQQAQYFKKLINKNDDTNKIQVENYLKLVEKTQEQKIKTGSFHVKNTSDRIEHQKMISKPESEKLKTMKISLEKSLKLIDSHVQELTQPDHKTATVKDEERLKFVSQMTKARKELNKKRQFVIQQDQEREKEFQIKQKEEMKKKDEEIRAKRKEDAMKKVQSLQTMRKNKKVQTESQNKELKIKLQEKILSERMMEKYNIHEQQLLNERKKKLTQIRSLHKPLTKSEFQLHLQKIQKLRNEKSRVVNQQEASRYITKDTSNFYKSKWYQRTKNEQKTYEDQKTEEEREEIKEMKDKLKKYSEYVRQNFKPEIDAKKVQQHKEMSQSSVPKPKTEDLRELGLKYLQWSKQHINPSKGKAQNQQEEDKNSMKVLKKINYLDQLKKNSKSKRKRKPQQILEELKNNKDLQDSQKAQKILQFIEGIQRKTKLRQQKGKANKVVVDEELDQMYMETIELKLKILAAEH